MFMSGSMKSTLMQLIAPSLAQLVPPMPSGFSAPSLLIDYENGDDYYTLVGFDPGRYTVTILDGNSDCPVECDYDDVDGDSWYKTAHGHGAIGITVKIPYSFDDGVEVVSEAAAMIEVYVAYDHDTDPLDADDLIAEIEAIYKGEDRRFVFLNGKLYLKIDD